jgi:hypothetical protein
LRHNCANPHCHRAKLWSRWLTRTEILEFGGAEYCCAGCAESVFEREIQDYLLRFRRENARPHRLPLGLLLISRGSLTDTQLQQALKVQRERPGRRLGRLLLEMGVLTEDALVSALGIQWGCPVYPLRNNRAYLDCVGLLPFALLHGSGVLPVHHSLANGLLHLAFAERIDHTLLYAIERMLGLRVVACVAPERAIAEALHHIRPSLLPQETVFDSVRSARRNGGHGRQLRGQIAGFAGNRHGRGRLHLVPL